MASQSRFNRLEAGVDPVPGPIHAVGLPNSQCLQPVQHSQIAYWMNVAAHRQSNFANDRSRSQIDRKQGRIGIRLFEIFYNSNRLSEIEIPLDPVRYEPGGIDRQVFCGCLLPIT